MNYLRHKAEDLIMDESFQQYCTGTNPVATRFWEQWQKEHPEKQELVRIAKVLYLRLNGGLSAEVFSRHHQQFTEAMLAQGIKPNTGKVVQRKNGWQWYALAVAAVLVLSLVSMLWMQGGKQPSTHIAAADPRPMYVSKAGERKSFQLPDGTKVVLNAGSTLWLEKGFHNGKRALTLEGEAFFDVAQDASAPFVIHTTAMKITVLGTAFNVKAYKDDETNETSLVRGLVRVDMEHNKQVFLHPNEKVIVPIHKSIIDKIEPISTKRAIPQKATSYYSIASLTHIPQDSTTVELSWVDNRLIFADETFGDIARKLERWYDVKIRFDAEALRDYRFTGHFNKETLQRVLEVMQLSRSFNFRFEDEHTVILNQ